MESLHLSAKQRQTLLAQLKQAGDVATYRRLVALSALAAGVSGTQLAQWLGTSRQSLYNWVARYLRSHQPSALRSHPHPGRPSLWDEQCVAVLRASLHQSPNELGYPAVNWTVGLLQDHLGRCLGRTVSDDTVRRQLHRLHYVWKRPRYVLKPDPQREKKSPLAPLVLATARAQRGAL